MSPSSKKILAFAPIPCFSTKDKVPWSLNGPTDHEKRDMRRIQAGYRVHKATGFGPKLAEAPVACNQTTLSHTNNVQWSTCLCAIMTSLSGVGLTDAARGIPSARKQPSCLHNGTRADGARRRFRIPRVPNSGGSQMAAGRRGKSRKFRRLCAWSVDGRRGGARKALSIL
ncbi:hypothetical protein BKA80DRAFT_281331 [Phyllosticta citrichinensis]